MAQLTGTIIAALVALVYGIIALFYPRRIQRWLTHDRLQRKVALKVYGRVVESPRYIRHLRVMGAVSLIFSALLFYFAFRLAALGR